MRGLKTYAIGGVLLWAGAVAMAQTPAKVTTPEQYDKVMKTVGPAHAATNKALKSAAYADARTSLKTVKDNLMLARTFWVEKKIDPALKLADDAIAKADALDKALAAATPDSAAVMAAAQAYGASCMACHKEYRIRDAEGNFIMDPAKVK